jgi:hypothetical protein
LEEGSPISKVAKKLRIKISTARLIVRKFKESGQFFIKNFKKNTPRLVPTASRPPVCPPSPSSAEEKLGVSCEQPDLNLQNAGGQ